MLSFVRGAFVADDEALAAKGRLTAATLALLLLSLLLIGVLNLVNATLHS